jgi:hypothetical protein
MISSAKIFIVHAQGARRQPRRTPALFAVGYRLPLKVGVESRFPAREGRADMVRPKRLEDQGRFIRPTRRAASFSFSFGSGGLTRVS